MKLLVIFCVLSSAYVNCQLASFIEPCHAKDTVCLKRSAQKAVSVVAQGVPALGMRRLDPLHVEHVDATKAGLMLHFRNTVVKGLAHCKVTDIGRPKSHETFVTLLCQNVELMGDYTLGGTLLFMDIRGQGKYKIKLREIRVTVVMKFGERSSGGERYWTMDSWKHRSDATEPVHYQFQNLFDGNKELSKTIHQVANENWHQIYEEVAPPIVKAITANVVAEIAKLFQNVPIRQLALD
ncbi:protein takeout-like [Maniola hyperantus]|uniref:protein takeout-like n=1 Tax=Aphantopus hyperantus TaxID=2795564 RepID=UPI00156A4584|nr:protein takeout-like [Maniola hyperantus]